MTDWKLVGGVSLIGITMGWLGSRLIPVKDNPKTVPSIEKDDDLNWGGDPDGQLAKALAKAREDSKKPRKPLEIVRLDSETFEAEAKPKLTPTQLKYLNMMKSNYNGYAYVEVDNRGWKPYKTRPVQTLLDKKIISIPKDNNHRFYGDVENFKAYNVIINPIALKYKYTNPFDGYNFTDKFAEYMAKQQPQQTSQTSSSNEIEIKYYMESHNEAKNQHKYYIAFKKGTDYYTAYGRLPNYGRETTIKVNKQPNAEKMNELVMKKMKTYRVERKDQIPSEIRRKLETELNSSLSPPKSETKEETVDEKDYNPYERMLRRRMGKGAETFGAWDKNCSVCNGTGWMPKKGDPKKDAELAKLFGLSIDELTLEPCNAGGKSMGCWNAETFDAEEEKFVDCYNCGRNIDLYDETNDSISCDECGKVACGSYKCNYSKNPKETWQDFTCGECVDEGETFGADPSWNELMAMLKQREQYEQHKKEQQKQMRNQRAKERRELKKHLKSQGLTEEEIKDYMKGLARERRYKVAETFEAEKEVYVLKFSDPMRYGKEVKLSFLTKNEAERYVDMNIRPYNKNRPNDTIVYSITKESAGFGAETFEAVVVNRGKQPKGALGKAVLNQRMIEQSKVMAILEELENKVRLGLVDEKQLMGDLKRRFGAESTPVTETDKYDEIASRFTLMELEIALVQSLNKKDMDAANQIMKVIQRKKFINEYQAENNKGR